MGNNRHIGIELLRVVSMLMIITLHWGGFGIRILELKPYSFEWFFSWGIRGFAYMSVNIYVLISAFFLSRRSGSINKLIQIWFEVFFYSMGIYLLTVLWGYSSFNVKSFIRFLTPVLSNAYWFVTSYFGMFILSPYLNKSLNALSYVQHRNLCIVLIVFFSVVPNFFFWSTWLNWGNSCGIVWFVVLYVIGSFLRRLDDEKRIRMSQKSLWGWSVLFWIMPILSKVLIAYIKQAITGDMVGSSVFYMNNSVIILGGSIFTFLAFYSLKISNNSRPGKIISFLASASFAVYLIHEHDCLREIIWNYVGLHTRYEPLYFVIGYVATITVIYCACSVLDFVRKSTFNLLKINTLANNITASFKDIYSKILS